MKWNWDVTVHTQSERLVTRTVSATTREVAERKVRRKFKPRPQRVIARMAADQPPTLGQLEAQHREICEKAGVV
jgi:hypothetical protein